MELNGVQSFSTAPQAVWDALHNPATLHSAAGIADVKWSDGSVSATISVPSIAGPFAGTRTLEGQIIENTPPSRLKIALSRGPINATATVDLAAEGAGTKLTYAISAAVSGPLGPMAEMGKPMIQSQINQLFAKLAQSV